MKVLKYVGKGRWEEVDEGTVLRTDKIRKVSRRKLTPAGRVEQLFDGVTQDI